MEADKRFLAAAIQRQHDLASEIKCQSDGLNAAVRLVNKLEARVAELEARLAEEVKDRDHWKALAESLTFPTPE